MLNSGPVRVLLGATVDILIGFLFYNHTLNPILMKIWIDEYYGGVDPKTDMTIPLISSIISAFVLTTFINQYVNYKQIATRRLFRMAVELWIMSICLYGPQVLWTSKSIKGFLVDQIYFFTVIVATSFAVGYNRFENGKWPKFDKFK